ncbi:MAG: 1-acyl-sn-glycerol-3-phosphate acyltransferase [Bryobacterales bacterium]|nr:1-acyl-sn-glycerol-3-phosphate acyltransferase [Bryobacterales bacterium]
MSWSYFRSIVYTAPLFCLATAVMGLISLCASLLGASESKLHRLAVRWAHMLLSIARVRVTVEGLEKLVPGESYVFAANHASYMDTPVILSALPVEFRFLAKEGLFQIPLLGTHLDRAGHLPVVRDNPRASLRSMSDAARIISDRDISVLVFPEGGRTPDGEVHEFKEGVAYIAIKAGVRVVPVALTGTREVLRMHSLNLRPHPVGIIIGDPIDTSGLTIRDREQLTLVLREQILDMLGQDCPKPQPAR